MKKNGVFTFKNFSFYPELIHGFSTRQWGNLRMRNFSWENSNLDEFLQALGIKRNQLVRTEQIHDGEVVVVKEKNRGQVIRGRDGLVTSKNKIYLLVQVADCLPIFFYDPKKKIVALCHAGWRGTLTEIAEAVIEKMKKLRSQTEDIIVGFGPHIKVCCYDVPQERLRIFQKKFGEDKKMFTRKDRKFYLDLTYLNLKQLKRAGVRAENIEISPYCTACDKRWFFSFRRDGQKNFSEMLGIIGRKS